jgi:hypothetical protein
VDDIVTRHDARRFAEVTFSSDDRAGLDREPALALPCTWDATAPVVVGHYVADTVPPARPTMLLPFVGAVSPASPVQQQVREESPS